MKILYVGPYPPSHDGIGTYTYAIADTVRNHGHDVCVVVPRQVAGSPDEVLGGLGWAIGTQRSLLGTVMAWAPDVVHVQFAVAAFGTRTPLLLAWMYLLRRRVQGAVIITMHEVTRDTALLRAPGRMLYRLFAGRCDRIIVHTSAARSALTRMGIPDRKTVIIPHPRARPPRAGSTPDDLRARFGLNGARILLAFGYIHVNKGLDDLVRALGILQRSPAMPLRDVRLVVAGDVRPRRGMFRVFEAGDRLHLAKVRRLTHRHDLERHLVWTGYVPDRDVAAWFQAAEAAVLPYRRIEQSGVAGLAGTFGVPVLASTAGGLGEQHAGPLWTFPARRPDCLALVLARFLSTAPAERGTVPGYHNAPDVDSVTAVTLDLYLEGSAGPAEGALHAG